MTPQEESSFCPYCLNRGLKNRIQPVQTNWKSAILLCQNPECIYPLDKRWSLIASDGKKLAEGERSVDENVFDTALKRLKLSDIEEKPNNANILSREVVDSKMDDDTSPNIKENPLSDNLSTDVIDDNFLEALLAGPNDNVDEFNTFLEHLSNLPNASFSSFSELPSSRIPEIRKQHNEVLKVVAPPVIVVSENPQWPRLAFLIDQRDGLASLESVSRSVNTTRRVDKSEPRRYAQWSEESNRDKGWLIAGLSVIVHCRIIRCVLKAVSQSAVKDKRYQTTSSIISSVCSEYELAMRKLLVALTLCNDTADTGLVNQVSEGALDSSQSNFDNLTFGCGYGVSIPRLLHQRVVDHLCSCKETVLQSMKESSVIANHPADVISYLMNSHDSLRELSVVSYRCNFTCSSCSYSCVEERISRAVTLGVPPSKSQFSLNGPDCCIEYYCPQCYTLNQNTHITWLAFSPILFLHFPKGLPDGCEFEKLSLTTNALNISREEIAGMDRFCITSRGQYEIRVSTVVTWEDKSGTSEYLTWVRRGSDSWMPCQEALGKNSHLAEWDPLTAPRKILRPASSVRIVLLEAVPVTRPNTTHSESGQQKQPRSRLHERVINIMRERKKQLRQQSGDSTAAVNSKNVSLPDVSPATSIMQRFLNSEVEHQVMLGGTSSRFQPYPTDRRARVARVNAKVGSESAPNLQQLESRVDVRPKMNEYHGSVSSSSVCSTRTKLSLGNRSKFKATRTRSQRPLVSYDIAAASLWPIPPKSMSMDKCSDAQSSKKKSSSSKSSSNSNDQQNLEGAVSYDLNSTTSFLEGHSAELSGSRELVESANARRS